MDESSDIRIAEFLDSRGPRGPHIKVYDDKNNRERTMLVWNLEERIIGANDNEPVWAIHAAQDAGWRVVYNMDDYGPPERIADELDADSPPHRRLADLKDD